MQYMRDHIFVPDEYYHIYSRGIEGRPIFLNNTDYWRFLTILFLFQWENYLSKPGDYTHFIQHSMSDDLFASTDVHRLFPGDKVAEIICFCLMPNHFHLLLKAVRRGGISLLMQRLGNSHTKHFNTKYARKGHLFQSRFQSVHVDSNEYLNHLSWYIHTKNPSELPDWRGKEIEYPWSSMQDFVTTNRWEKLLSPGIILDQFSNKEEYAAFLAESNTGNIALDDYYLIDNI